MQLEKRFNDPTNKFNSSQDLYFDEGRVHVTRSIHPIKNFMRLVLELERRRGLIPNSAGTLRLEGN